MEQSFYIANMYCSHGLRKLTGLLVGKKRLGVQVRLGGHWKGEGRSLRSHEPDTEQAGLVENEVISHKPHGRS